MIYVLIIGGVVYVGIGLLVWLFPALFGVPQYGPINIYRWPFSLISHLNGSV